MSLTPGTHLGPYEILAPLGAGGMGEVYRAKDPKLGREVAIKVLPEAFSTDADRLRRFEQEARTLSALNHPNILTVFDLGSHEGTPYLVMELLEGETLREKLGGKALPARKATEIALQVARGLSAAHAQGILHRDLKPENLFHTKDGRVKILDFGLAKVQPGSVGSESATRAFLSEPGTVVGTSGYMSPEQVQGERLDVRSDLFSLGVVLWELLTGQGPFHRASAIDTLHAILREEPPELDPGLKVPPGLLRILDTCLAKDPAARFHAAHDLAFALEGLMESSAGSGSRVAAAPDSRNGWARRTPAWMLPVLALLLVVAGGILAWLTFRDRPRPTVVRSMITPPKGVEIVGRGYAIGLALSPDGRKLAFVGSTDTTTCLFLRSLDSLEAEPLPGTVNARIPFWSPDGREVAFFADRRLKVVTISSRSVRSLCETGLYPLGGTWGADGTLYFTSEGDVGPISRVAAVGGNPVPLTSLDPTRKELSHVWPSLLPGGRHLLFSAFSQVDGFGLRILSLATGRVESLLPGIVRAEGIQDFLVYESKDALLAQRLDQRTFKPLGQAVVLVRGVNTKASAECFFSPSADGTLACLLPSRPDTPNLVWFDGAGHTLGVMGSSPWYRNLMLSPEGDRVAADVQGIGEENDHSEVRLIDLRSAAETRLTADSFWASDPAWSPDGARLVMMALGAQNRRIVELDVKGSASPRTLFEGEQILFPRDWSADGKALLLELYGNPGTHGDVLALRPAEAGEPKSYRATKANEWGPQFSPDGTQVAYASDETGREEVYVGGFPEVGTPRLASSAGGNHPRWARDGQALYYLSLNDELMKVSVRRDGGKVAFGVPLRLFRVRAFPYNGHPFDVHPKGQRFLFSTAHDEGTSIVLIQNWALEVK